MQLDFLFNNSAQVDVLRSGKMAVRTDRWGASPSRYQKADSEDSAFFDAALESTRARRETAGPPSPDSRETDPITKTAGNSFKNRDPSSAPEKSPEDGWTTQASQSSDGHDMAMAPTALPTDDNPPEVAVSAGMASASDMAAENQEPQLVSAAFPSSEAGRSAGGLTVDGARSTPASPVAAEPLVAVASCQVCDQFAVETAETGNESTVFQGPDTEKVDAQASTAKSQTSATMVSAPAADGATDATMTDAAVQTTQTRLEKGRHQNRVEKDAGGSTEKSAGPSPSSSAHGDPHGPGRAVGFSSVFNGLPSGDGLLPEFGQGAGRDVDAYCGEPQASEKGAERPLWSTSALKTVDGGFQESTDVTSAKSATESEQRVADMLLAPQRAVNGAGEAAAATETGEAHPTKELRAEIQNQIVDKAVFRLRNGQSEARIDLKPDSLGHVKLQIVTQNHQVTLRIMAESHAAKHTIDSGIGQLKADLQAQGLKIDELEVSVATEFNDFNRHSAFSDDAAQARRLPSTGGQSFQETVPAASLKPAMDNRATAGVDCFV